MVLVIGFIIPPYVDSLSLNPLRSTLCHAWLTCLRWCQVLAVSRRLPYATVLPSPPMSVKRMSALAQNTVRRGAHPETLWQWRNTHMQSHSYIHTPVLYTPRQTFHTTNADTVEYKQNSHILFEILLVGQCISSLQKGPDMQLLGYSEICSGPWSERYHDILTSKQ